MQTETLCACPHCASSSIFLLDTITNVPVDAPPHAIWRCRQCEVCFCNPRVYNSGAEVGSVAEYVRRTRSSGLIAEDGTLAKERLQQSYPEICSLVDLVYDGSLVLDVGCGIGLSTAALQASGFRVQGIDINAEMIEAGRSVLNLDLKVADVSSIETSYQVITANSVLEHVHDAVGFLKSLHSKTKYLVVTVPNILDLSYIERGPTFGIQMNWAHVWYFEEKTLERVLESAGFRVLDFYRPTFMLDGVLGKAMRFMRDYSGIQTSLYGGIGCLAESR